MSATLTLVENSVIGAGLRCAVYTCLLDNSLAAGGEPVDISGEFSNVYAIAIGGNDTLADNSILWSAVLPGAATAVTSSNVKICGFWSADGTDGEAFVEAAAADVSSVGALSLVVIGK